MTSVIMRCGFCDGLIYQGFEPGADELEALDRVFSGLGTGTAKKSAGQADYDAEARKKIAARWSCEMGKSLAAKE